MSCFSAVLLVTNLQGCTEEEFGKPDTCMGIVDGICERSQAGYEVLDKANMEERKARTPAFELECAGYGLTNKGLGKNGDAQNTPLFQKCMKCESTEKELNKLAICTASHTAAGATSAAERQAVIDAQNVPIGGDIGSAGQQQASQTAATMQQQLLNGKLALSTPPMGAQPRGAQPGAPPPAGAQPMPGQPRSSFVELSVPADGRMEPHQAQARPVNA